MDAVPTLTCHNAYLLVLSVADVINDVADEEREFFRWLHDSERLALQGLPPDMLQDLPCGKAIKAAGNAFPVPLIIACLHPMLMAASESIRTGVATVVSECDPGELARFESALCATPLVANASKARKARAKKLESKALEARKRKRKRDESS